MPKSANILVYTGFGTNKNSTSNLIAFLNILPLEIKLNKTDNFNNLLKEINLIIILSGDINTLKFSINERNNIINYLKSGKIC